MNEPQLITAPTFTPISLNDLKQHLRLTGHDEDPYLSDLIDVATDTLQAKAWRQFCTATYAMRFKAWQDEMHLIRSPLASVTSVTYVDSTGTTQTLSTDIYEVATYQTPGFIRLKYSQTWPTIRGHADDITITYVCGQAADDIPDRNKQAVKLFAAHLYQQRTQVIVGRIVAEIPMGVMWLLDRAGVPV